jgi:hypothetical protein
MRITVENLIRVGASCNQVEIFRQEWPEGAEVNLVNARRAVDLRLNLNWAAQRLFSPNALRAYRESVAAAAQADRAWDEAFAAAFCAAVEKEKP